MNSNTEAGTVSEIIVVEVCVYLFLSLSFSVRN